MNNMARKHYTPEQIIRKLREAEVLIGQGQTTSYAARQIGIAEQTYYKWHREYCGMRIVADKELDIQILKETLHLESKNV